MIGLFDSGSGGLSVLATLRERAPGADIIYFGDIKNAPYGEKSPQELADLTRAGVRILREHGATEIVSACNSVSFSVLAGAAGNERIIEMTRPAAHMMREHAGSRVLLIATPATIAAKTYQDALGNIVELDTLPIRSLAGAIEFEEGDEAVRSIVRQAFAQRVGKEYAVLLLGCTHYPFAHEILADEAQRAFGSIALIDPAHAVARAVAERFDIRGSGTTRFVITRDTHAFRNRISPFFLTSHCELEVI